MTSPAPQLAASRVLVVGTADWTERLAATFADHAKAVETVETATGALEAVRQDRVDCLVTGYRLPDTTGVELVTAITEAQSAVPVVLCATAGSEAVASNAIEAGVDDYVVLDQPVEGMADELLARTGAVVQSARQAATRRERARQFDAVFHDTQTATWVLDPDGSLARANQTAYEMVETDIGAFVGEPFWKLPWWGDGAAMRTDVRELVENATDGGFGTAVITPPPDVADRRVVDLSVRPVSDKRGDLVAVVVEGVDITGRVELERDLRRSEELHRVTLNNMTDTVLMTNEAGEYTYVCPNVHFIFGYSAEEIRDQGTIDELLGKDLFDREELAAGGVIKNIECTATDKAGRTHTLLVNVREVSIQDGTLLYSCRDITKRKQREEALATLQETARDFLYAETHREIARRIVDDTPGVLAVDAGAVYLFDADDNELRPAAHTGAMTELHGPLVPVPADGETLPSHSFLADETLCFDNVHEADLLETPVTDLRSASYIPLGNHGVFVAGSTEVGRFDDVTRELADLLAATAEAALDRVSREAKLRNQDRQLQQRNEELSVLNRINETIRDIDQAIVRAETHQEVDRAVCERLTDDERFRFAWVGAVDPMTETVEPRTWAGAEQGYLDSQSFQVAESATEPAGRTAATGEVAHVTDVAAELRDEDWRTDALRREFASVLSIPLVYNDLTHGVLTVYADTPEAFDETARSVLAELGETIAAALSAIERKNALLTTSMRRVEFGIDDPTFLLTRLARRAECTVRYEGGIQQSTGRSDIFVTVDDRTGDAVTDVAAELAAVAKVHRITADDDQSVLRLGLTRPFLAQELADHGAIFREATADPASTTFVVDVPESIAVRKITAFVRETFPDADLHSKRTLDGAVEWDLRSSYLEKLTDRQIEVVQTAYYSGYFESPRASNGEDVAETLDISPPAFYEHVRAVQRKLLATVFEEHGTTITPSS